MVGRGDAALDDSAWRGSILDTASKQIIYVRSTSDIVEFLDARLAENEPKPQARER
jgi:hypothetical protein